MNCSIWQPLFAAVGACANTCSEELLEDGYPACKGDPTTVEVAAAAALAAAAVISEPSSVNITGALLASLTACRVNIYLREMRKKGYDLPASVSGVVVKVANIALPLILGVMAETPGYRAALLAAGVTNLYYSGHQWSERIQEREDTL